MVLTTSRVEHAAAPARRFSVRGRLLLDGSLRRGALVVEGGRIVEVREEGGGLPSPVYDAPVVAPGFIDLQVNGGFGLEVGSDPEAIRRLAARLPASGVTAFLPTLVTSPPDFYPKVFAAFAAACESPGARPLGLHLEGPFLSPRRAGAHRPALIEGAPPELLDRLIEDRALRLMTLAPERPGALDRIERLRGRGVTVSLGHTDATYDEFVRGIDAGATLVTHLYSAMSAFQHRSPGAIGAALVDDRVSVALIVDGVHCHPAAVRLAVKAKGPEGVVLVTDAVAGAGAGPGRYAVNGQRIVVDEHSARLPDGTLAGSILRLNQAVANVVRLAGVRVEDALRMASENPARVLGLATKGRLAPGLDADLVLLGERLDVQATIVGGCRIHACPARPTAVTPPSGADAPG
jgi:N-acetylglucosamine-6-phosphate deacetylase